MIDLPKFFSWVDAGDTNCEAYPVNWHLDDWVCPRCGYTSSIYKETGGIRISGHGPWPDILPVNAYVPWVVSEKIVNGLHDIKATGFQAIETPILTPTLSLRREKNVPRYYYLYVTGRATQNTSLADSPDTIRCDGCHRQMEGTRKLNVPLQIYEESWSGDDVFLTYVVPIWTMLWCTRRIVELARRDKWTNARFDIIDLPMRLKVRWPGIDYLGDHWPPKQWRPYPAQGKTVEEWIALLPSPDKAVAESARDAIVDLGPQAVPLLAKQLSSPTDRTRHTAARLIHMIEREHYLPEDIMERTNIVLTEWKKLVGLA